jgi:uncharacterized protein YecT (DUF1311 family)
MRILNTFAVLVFILAPHQTAAEAIDCSNPSHREERNFCADKEFTAADAELNAVYKKLLAYIAESDGSYDAKSWEAALRVSQRAWIAFRDAECDGLMATMWSDGTDQMVVTLRCMTELTQARSKSLKSHMGLDGPAKAQ